MNYGIFKTKYRARDRRGFTLVELVVVLAILAILLALAAGGLNAWFKHSNYIHNEQAARTVFVGVQNSIADAEAQGTLGDELEQLEKNSRTQVWNGFRYVVVTTEDYENYCNGGGDALSNWFFDLVQDELDCGTLFASSSSLYPSVAVEFRVNTDAESLSVYSVFYATWANTLNYDKSNTNTNNPHGDVSIAALTDRAPVVRRPLCLGYYSAEDSAHVAQLSATKLKVNNVRLVNEESLYLQFAGSVDYLGQDENRKQIPVSYEIQLKNAKTDALICTMTLDTTKIKNLSKEPTVVTIPTTIGDIDFPIQVEGKVYRVTLDAMLDGVTMGVYESEKAAKSGNQINKTVSIRRLLEKVNMEDQPDIYAVVSVNPVDLGALSDSSMYSDRDYSGSSGRISNTENAYFGSVSADGTMVELSAFRHLYNLRYFEDTDSAKNVTFRLSRDLDWSTTTAPYYRKFDPNTDDASWTHLNAKECSTFSVPEVKANWTLEGGNHMITGIRLTADSNVLIRGSNLNKNYADKLALILVNNGTIQNLKLRSITVQANVSKDKLLTNLSAGDMPELRLAAGLAAESAGTISGVSVYASERVGSNAVSASVRGGEDIVSGVALIVGHADLSGDGAVLSNLNTAALTNKDLGSSVRGWIVTDAVQEIAFTVENVGKIQAGIGGTVGFASGVKAEACITNITNGADASGNIETGGVVGRAVSQTAESTIAVTDSDDSVDQIKSCQNTGLVLCTAENGGFVGGVSGYSDGVSLNDCTSAPGYKAAYSGEDAKTALMADCKGCYVGGIAGYVTDGRLYACSTRRSGGTMGYVLGHDYVGGIAGGITGSTGSIGSTGEKMANECYVIGYNYVGGVVGSNRGTSEIVNCINKGIVGGYKESGKTDGGRIGGITGENVGTDENHIAKVKNCTSYCFDNGGTYYSLANDKWKVDADNVGGIVGYQDFGEVVYENASGARENAVSSIVVGGSNVGGIVGWNGANGDVTLDHGTIKVIGGQIHGRGDNVGGLIGHNESAMVFDDGENVENYAVKPYSVEGNNNVGGIIGENCCSTNATILLYADNRYGTVKGTANVGGIVGYNSSDAALVIGSDSLTSAIGCEMSVSGETYVGGIVGKNDAAKGTLTIRRYTNSGEITANGTGTPLNDLLAEADRLTEFKSVSINMIGGIIGLNEANCTIDACTNSGKVNIPEGKGIGGITALNKGVIRNCIVTSNLGAQGLDFVGGITAINYREAATGGLVENCAMEATSLSGASYVQGGSYVGGLVAFNMSRAAITGSTSNANVDANGNCVGGLVGENRGKVTMAATMGTKNGRIMNLSIVGGENVGGLIGKNTEGTINTATELQGSATSSGVTVTGTKYVGGLVGYQENGSLSGTENAKLVNEAAVTASVDRAGGIIGGTKGSTSLTYVVNCGTVTAEYGNAGGIAANEPESATSDVLNISYAENCASVIAPYGRAGGIVTANNTGSNLSACSVYADSAGIQLNSGETELVYMGGLTTENRGTVESCSVGSAVAGKNGSIRVLGGSKLGGVCGANAGTITDTAVAETVYLDYGSSGSDRVIVGGIAAENNKGAISRCSVTKYFDGGTQSGNTISLGRTTKYTINSVEKIFYNSLNKGNVKGFSNVTYLGGIAGLNQGGTVTGCNFTGAIVEESSAKGNAYGGIVGQNETVTEDKTVYAASVSACYADNVSVYVTTGAIGHSQSNTASEKKSLDVSVGGIAGASIGNESKIIQCSVTGAKMYSGNSLLGGIAGYNEGVIRGNENSTLGTSNLVAKGKSFVGGITALNAPGAAVTSCTTGEDVTIYHESNDDDACVAGMIAMNNSYETMTDLNNGASVYKRMKQVVGGIIGRQEVQSATGWLIQNCSNSGMIVSGDSNRAAGIVGNVKFYSGTIDQCTNTGSIYAVECASGIVGGFHQLNCLGGGAPMTFSSCTNRGTIAVRNGSSYAAGMLARSEFSTGTNLTYFVDCVNEGTIGQAIVENSEVKARDSAGVYCHNNEVKATMVNCTNTGAITGTVSRYAITNQSDHILYNCKNEGEPTNMLLKPGSGNTDQSTAAITWTNPGVKLEISGLEYKVSWNEAANADGYVVELYRQTKDGEFTDFIGTITVYGRSKKSVNFLLEESGNSYVKAKVTAFNEHEEQIDGKTETVRNTAEAWSSAVQERIALPAPDFRLVYKFQRVQQSTEVAPKVISINAFTDSNMTGLVNNSDMDPMNGFFDGSTSAANRTAWDNGQYIVFALDKSCDIANVTVTYVTPSSNRTVYSYLEYFDETDFAWKIFDGRYNNSNRCETNTKSSNDSYPATFTATGGSVSAKQFRICIPKVDGSSYRCISEVDIRDTKDNRILAGSGELDPYSMGILSSSGFQFQIVNTEEYLALGTGENALAADRIKFATNLNNATTVTKSVLNGTPVWVASTTHNSISDIISVQAQVDGTFDNYGNSATTAKMCCIKPYYDDLVKLGGSGTPVLSGTDVENFSISNTLRAADGTGVPIYRVELVGVDAEGTQTVIRWKNLGLTNVDTNVTFDGFQEGELWESGSNTLKYDHIYMRAWLAQSGKGPVYYYDPDTDVWYESQTGTAPIDTSVSAVIAAREDYQLSANTSFYYASGNLTLPNRFQPVVLTENAESMVGVWNETDRTIEYTFHWTDDNNIGKPSYNVTVYKADTEIQLAHAEGITGNECFFQSNDWSCEKVDVVVERVGEVIGGKSYLSIVTETKGISIRCHLPQVGQPIVTLLSQDDLKYAISWNYSNENCGYYQLYLQEGEQTPDGILGSIPRTGSTQLLDSVDLEEYVGKHIVLYVVAYPEDETGRYIRSMPGVAVERTIPNRMTMSEFTLEWDSGDWVTAPGGTSPGVVPESLYEEGGLTLLAHINESERLIGNYLLGGIIYPREGTAENVLNTLLGTNTALSKPVAQVTVGSGNVLDEPAVSSPMAGYELEGWYKDPQCTTRFEEFGRSLESDLNLYAKWSGAASSGQHTATFYVNNGTDRVFDTEIYHTGSALTQPEGQPSWYGHTFVGWSTDRTQQTVITDWETISGDVKLYAVWENTDPAVGQVSCEVEFKLGTETDAEVFCSVTVAKNEQVGLPWTQPEQDGFIFLGWQYLDANNKWQPFVGGSVSENLTVYANWQEKTEGQHTAMFYLNNGAADSNQTLDGMLNGSGSNGVLPIISMNYESDRLYTAGITQGVELEDAGKSLVLSLRSVSNTGISSWWKLAGESLRLPLAKLTEPTLSEGIYTETGAYCTLDGEAYPNTEVTRREISWTPNDHADFYTVQITNFDKQVTTIQCRAAAGGGMQIMQDDRWITVTPDEQGRYMLGAMHTVNGYVQFTDESGTVQTYPYTAKLNLYLMVTEEQGEVREYRLVLPDLNGSVTFGDEIETLIPVLCTTNNCAGVDVTAGVDNSTQYVSSDKGHYTIQ